MNKPPEIINQAFDAWIEDITTNYDLEGTYRPTMQAQIIPLACVWSIANVRFGKRPQTVWDFTQDVLSHDRLPGIWNDYASFSGDPSVGIQKMPFARYMEILNSTDSISPYRFERDAAQDGRPAGGEFMSGTEKSLISTIGHAAYNSTSGGRYLVLHPEFGPPKDDMYGFLQLAGENVIEFTENNLLS